MGNQPSWKEIEKKWGDEVKRTLHELKKQYPDYNIMIFHTGKQPYEQNLNGVHKTWEREESASGHSTKYTVWIFESGEFKNKGDGGWINWAFCGNFKRGKGDGSGYVQFYSNK